MTANELDNSAVPGIVFASEAWKTPTILAMFGCMATSDCQFCRYVECRGVMSELDIVTARGTDNALLVHGLKTAEFLVLKIKLM